MKKNKFTGLILLILAIAVTSCGKKEAEKGQAAESQLPKVKIATVNERDVEQVQTFTATVEPEVKNNIAPASPGRIRNIFVEVGATVSKGQRLAQMDAVNLSNSETQIENLRRMYKRVAELFSVGGASQQELDNAKLQLDVAETNLKNLSENTYLHSPINGVVTARNYDVGDMYTGQMALLTVMQINPVKLKINVSESYYSKIKVGMPVEVKVDVFENETFPAKVSLIYPVIDERTRTFAVELKLSNPGSKVRPGMFARVDMNFGTEKHVVVPDRSIVKQTGSGSRYVFVYSDGKVKYTEVKLGRRIDNEYELFSGVSNGQQIVVSGLNKLQDGMEVEVVK
ncbi:MAG: efflux RND transporter periplasmic adaptor subunit [Paludibacter sp.]|jgi:RND family efflux transporter MFP subunit|nr:efflux RND transporter periplasmic adaptor subunit [Paludibacter sp.]MDX9919554.1 efflux RND transporter periplasmic adaptor subunit [Paludibacter sp.]